MKHETIDPKQKHQLQCPQCEPADELRHLSEDPESTDVLGSYTGTPRDGGVPEQDPDDL